MIVNLLSDEMSIMKHLQFLGNKFVGLVNLGEEKDSSELAAEGLSLRFIPCKAWVKPTEIF